jgi:hypothetical protein
LNKTILLRRIAEDAAAWEKLAREAGLSFLAFLLGMVRCEADTNEADK